jgi:hypothetical protein
MRKTLVPLIALSKLSWGGVFEVNSYTSGPLSFLGISGLVLVATAITCVCEVEVPFKIDPSKQPNWLK